MKKYNEQNYIDAIQSVYPESWYIRQPDIKGFVGTVFFAETENGTIVCKFNDKDIIQHNYQISQLLQPKDMIIPHTQKHMFADTYFESYKYCPGKTLYEYMKNDMTPNQIFDIYKQTIPVQQELSKIPPEKIKCDWGNFAYQSFVRCRKKSESYLIALAFGFLYKTLSTRGKPRLFHNDIQPKNLLVDEDMNLSGIIDLDSIALCNESFAVLYTLYTYPLNNYAEYIECYEDTVGRKLNKRGIIDGLKLLQQIRNIKRTLQK